MQDLSLLQQSFENFTRATSELKLAYARLEERFARLNRELEDKNAELLKTIAEKEQARTDVQNILESLINGVIVTDPGGKITRLNSCAEIFTGVKAADVLGKPISALFAQSGADGWQTINPAEYFRGESGHKVKTGDRTLEIFGSPFLSPQGAVLGHVFALRDITRVEKLEAMAVRTEIFAAMGEMAANIAHEVRNPLGSIELFASLLQKDLKDKKDRERAAQIISCVKNVDNKISNLLLFTRRPSPRLKHVFLHGLLREVMDFTGQIIGRTGVEVCVHFAAEDIFIAADAELIKQVFWNVILNAQQAMPEGGRLDISTRLSPKSLLSPRDRYAEIIFRDTGPGISPSELSRIFDPFYSTREGGSGLGLAIAHNIVSEHQGSISVENAPGGGVAVNIGLPACPAA